MSFRIVEGPIDVTALSADVLPAGHPFRMLTPMRYGITMTGLGRFDQAQQSLLESLKRLDAVEGANPQWKGYVMQAMVQLYEKWNRPEEAATWRERLNVLSTPKDGA